jgi:hypothetical protein
MADCSPSVTGSPGRIDTTRMQGRNCEAEDGEFGRSRGVVCSLSHFGFLCSLDLVDGPPQPTHAATNRRDVSLFGPPHSARSSWIGPSSNGKFAGLPKRRPGKHKRMPLVSALVASRVDTSKPPRKVCCRVKACPATAAVQGPHWCHAGRASVVTVKGIRGETKRRC